MHRKSSDKFLIAKRHRFGLTIISVIFIAECRFLIRNARYPMIANGHFVRVYVREIGHSILPFFVFFSYLL
jgi:hypothetical protein